jgi:hypothetical protein
MSTTVHVKGAGPIDPAILRGHQDSPRRLGERMGQSMAVGQQFRKLLGY